MATGPEPDGGLLFQVDEKAPSPLVVGIGLQYAVLSISSMMLMPTVAFRAAGAPETAVVQAAWFGVPTDWPGHFAVADDLDFATFAGMVPAFVLLYLICTIRSMSSSLAIQTVSWRDPRAMDFRPVQGAIGGDALSNLAAGLAGTMPNGAHSGTVARTQLTGVAARPVGLMFGAAVILLAFCPKVVALVLAVPGPVFAGYVTVMIAATFTIGLKMAVSEGADHRQGLIIGLAFWIGAGCQYGFIFPEFVATFTGGMLKSALTAGGLVAILLTAILVLTAPRRQRLETRLSVASLPELRDFVHDLAKLHRWGSAMSDRLEAVAEEMLLTLLRDDQDPPSESGDCSSSRRARAMQPRSNSSPRVVRRTSKTGSPYSAKRQPKSPSSASSAMCRSGYCATSLPTSGTVNTTTWIS